MLTQFTKMEKTQRYIGKHSSLTLTYNRFVLSCSGCLPTIILHLFTKSELSVIKRRKHILSEIKYIQKITGRWSLTFWHNNQYVASFFRSSVEFEVRSLIIAKIQSYYTGKNVPFMNHGNLGPRKIDPILNASIPFVVLYLTNMLCNQTHWITE